ncbi:uncharacterized protein [Montipora capricornis]|uniref:uncharacterized protein isoform X2 n=1 Tax=Montipora capricornis TaxID=246305 RepID=UPI0035F1DC9F
MGEFAARHEVYSKTSLPSGGTGYDAAISPEAGMRGKERRENEFAMQKMTQRSPTLFLPQCVSVLPFMHALAPVMEMGSHEDRRKLGQPPPSD